MRQAPRKFQNGLTLVELMIAIFLGMLVVASMFGVYYNSKESYQMTLNMARLQEDGRMAMSLISRDLRWADYRRCVTADLRDDAVAGTNNAGLNGSDTITTLYQSNECGDAVATVTNAYSVQAGSSGEPSLFRSTDGGAAVELVEGIENLQVLYGEDTDEDDVPNYYVDVGSLADASQVVSVRVILTARTADLLRTAGNNRISRNFTSTVVLRNRVP